MYHRIENINLDADFFAQPTASRKQFKKETIKKGDKFFEENTPWQGFWKIITGKGPYEISDHMAVDIPSIYTSMYMEKYGKKKRK